jgi:hypothetical protein
LTITAIDRHNNGNPHRMDLNGTATPSLSGTVTWSWQDGAVTIASSQNVNNYDFATGGLHSLTLTATKGSCVYTVTQSVSVP